MPLILNGIVAMCPDLGIGRDGHLPWHPTRLNDEFKYFRKMTATASVEAKKNVVIMGRKTWFSIPEKNRPLNKRINIVLSRQLKVPPTGAHHLAPDFCSALRLIDTELSDQADQVWVIGGSSLYKELMLSQGTKRLFVTQVLKQFPCDTFFPEFCSDKYNLLPGANLAHELPGYRQHVTCPTRGAQTLDHCYTVIKDAYHSAARAALGLSDHCLVHLIPAYRQKLKTSKPVEAAQSQGGGLQEWRPRPVQADQKHTEPRVWKGLQSITGYKKRTPRPVESPRLANQLNKFYRRFDRSFHTTGLPAAQSTYSPLPTTALSTPLSSLSHTLSLAEAAPALHIREEEVRQMFRRQKTRKAPGPDAVSPSSLKVCAEQLAPTFAWIFNRSLELCEVPSCFKSSTIVLVAKKPAITGLNDYRPVALTYVVMKCFERLVLNHLKEVTGLGRHYILHHLDTPGTYARILFVDFSSTFNTIAPDILQQKLIQLAVPASTCQWITSFLTNRRERDSPVKLLKYADDTTHIRLIQDGDETAYRQKVERLVHWCSQNHLTI
ncbi:dihydrofolate reductase isoform 5-T5 [Syngnathus typhle]